MADTPNASSGEEPPHEVPIPEADQDKPCWYTQDLMRGGKEALIVHDGALYRLKVTRRGKLILFK